MNPLTVNLGDLCRIADAETRSISPENPTGERGGGARAEPESHGPARELGRGWKAKPCQGIASGETFTLADIAGAGVIQSIWMTPSHGQWRHLILRMYWDEQETPAVVCPLGDFFACGWGIYAPLSSLAVCVNPARGFNCYWQMPFRRRCRVTLENIGRDEMIYLFYQINYALTAVPEDAAYFHAQFRRVNPTPYGKPYVVLDGVSGRGQYVGTYMAWGVNNCRWWGEGEMKFYLDDDDEYPTLCGTGTEDYFGGAYDFLGNDGNYETYATPYAGLAQVIRPDGKFQSQQRFGMYRWHLTDPARFRRRLRVEIQPLGWRDKRLYLPLQDDLASVAYWYQTLPTAPVPPLPERDYLEVV
jgi:hypothetical protein